MKNDSIQLSYVVHIIIINLSQFVVIVSLCCALIYELAITYLKFSKENFTNMGSVVYRMHK